MDRWTNMMVFARVARLGSFTQASEELRMSTTAVSRRVSELETHLGVRLLRRTTRSLSLTEQGQQYLHRCEMLLDEVEQLEAEVASAKTAARGILRVTAGTSFTQEQLAPLLPKFCEQYPDVEIHLSLTDKMLDLIESGIDVAIRIGVLQSSSHKARRFTRCRHVLCASPDYLSRYGTPTTLNELAQHSCVIDTNQSRIWTFHDGAEVMTFQPQGQLFVNNADVVKQAVLAGTGIGLLPTFVAGDELDSGALVPLLSEYRTYESSIYAVFPAQRHVPAKLRVFLDFLEEHWSPEAPWDSWTQ